MDIANFFANPIGNAVAAYTGVMGVWFYGSIMAVTGVYILMKTESGYVASTAFIFMSILFSAILPPYLVFIWAIAAVFCFAFLLLDILVLK